MCSPLRKHCTPAFSAPLLGSLQLCQGRQSSKLLSDPLQPTSSRAKNESVLGLYQSGVDSLLLIIASAPDNYCDANGI